MRNLCGFPIPIKFQVATIDWQQRYTFPQITAYTGYSESGVITDVLIAKITRRSGSFSTTKSKRTQSWQPWAKHAANHFNTCMICGHNLDNYITHSLATSHFRQNRLLPWSGATSVRRLGTLRVKRLFFLRQRRCILCPCLCPVLAPICLSRVTLACPGANCHHYLLITAPSVPWYLCLCGRWHWKIFLGLVPETMPYFLVLTTILDKKLPWLVKNIVHFDSMWNLMLVGRSITFARAINDVTICRHDRTGPWRPSWNV